MVKQKSSAQLVFLVSSGRKQRQMYGNQRQENEKWNRKSWNAGQFLRGAWLPLACWAAAHRPQWWRVSSRRLPIRRSHHFRIKF
jgi:hypothetical protein